MGEVGWLKVGEEEGGGPGKLMLANMESLVSHVEEFRVKSKGKYESLS